MCKRLGPVRVRRSKYPLSLLSPESILLFLLLTVSAVSTTLGVHSTRTGTRPSALKSQLLDRHWSRENFHPASLCFSIEKCQKWHWQKAVFGETTDILVIWAGHGESFVKPVLNWANVCSQT